MRKKEFKKVLRVLVAFAICFTLISSFIITDASLIKNERNPFFSLPVIFLKDGGSTQYTGLGYSIWKINSLSEKEIDSIQVSGMIKGYRVQIMFITVIENSKFVQER